MTKITEFAVRSLLLKFNSISTFYISDFWMFSSMYIMSIQENVFTFLCSKSVFYVMNQKSFVMTV